MRVQYISLSVLFHFTFLSLSISLASTTLQVVVRFHAHARIRLCLSMYLCCVCTQSGGVGLRAARRSGGFLSVLSRSCRVRVVGLMIVVIARNAGERASSARLEKVSFQENTPSSFVSCLDRVYIWCFICFLRKRPIG